MEARLIGKIKIRSKIVNNLKILKRGKSKD